MGLVMSFLAVAQILRLAGWRCSRSLECRRAWGVVGGREESLGVTTRCSWPWRIAAFCR